MALVHDEYWYKLTGRERSRETRESRKIWRVVKSEEVGFKARKKLKLVVKCLRAWSWRPILFVILINDIEDGICGNILKFADDTKLFCKVGSDINCAQLRADLRKLYN